MMTCAEATHLASDRMHQSVSLGARLALRIHLLLCSGCRHYEQQVALMRNLLRSKPMQQPDPSALTPARLSAEARTRIQMSLSARTHHQRNQP